MSHYEPHFIFLQDKLRKICIPERSIAVPAILIKYEGQLNSVFQV